MKAYLVDMSELALGVAPLQDVVVQLGRECSAVGGKDAAARESFRKID